MVNNPQSKQTDSAGGGGQKKKRLSALLSILPLILVNNIQNLTLSLSVFFPTHSHTTKKRGSYQLDNHSLEFPPNSSPRTVIPAGVIFLLFFRFPFLFLSILVVIFEACLVADLSLPLAGFIVVVLLGKSKTRLRKRKMIFVHAC